MPNALLNDVPQRLAPTRWTAMTAGGHFAALEESQVLVEDIRALYRALR